MSDATRESVRSYSSNFDRDEDPISEGGLWLNGLTDGIDWIDCHVARWRRHGQAGTQQPGGAARGAGQPRLRRRRADG